MAGSTTDIRSFDGSNWVSLQGPPGTNGGDGDDGKGLNGTMTGVVTTVPPEANDGDCSTLSAATMNGSLVPDAEGNFTLNLDLGIPGGVCGASGDSATVSLSGSTTETLEPGNAAEVIVNDLNGSDPNDLKLNFSFKIPKGEKGDGITIKDSVATEDLLPSCDTPGLTVGDMYIVAVNEAGEKGHGYVYNGPDSDPCFTDIGQIKGEDGTAGCNPDITVGTVETSTLEAGNDATASVTRTGTDCEPVLGFSFGIPSGTNGKNGTSSSIALNSSIGLGDRCVDADDASASFTRENDDVNNPIYKANFTIPYVKVHKGSDAPLEENVCAGDFWIVTD